MSKPNNSRLGSPAKVEYRDVPLDAGTLAGAEADAARLRVLFMANTTVREIVSTIAGDGPTSAIASGKSKKWSDPDTIKRWAKLFRKGRNDFLEYLAAEKIRYERIGANGPVSIVLEDIPECVRERMK